MNVSSKHAYVLIALTWVLILSFIPGAIMRESDQAALLDGAISIFSNSTNLHNYSGQYGSYWLLSLFNKISPSNYLSEYISKTNFFSFIALALSILSYVFSSRTKTYGRTNNTLLLISLTTPVFLLSAPLLSSNVLSGSCILFLLSLKKYWSQGSVIALIVSSLLVFSAVSLRNDAAFLLPIICITPLGNTSIFTLKKHKYFWCFLVSSLLSFSLGKTLAPERYLPSVSLNWQLISCYLFFGLLGSLMVTMWAIFITCRNKANLWTRTITILALCLPIIMYLPVLYSPRHLFMASLVPLILINSDWSKKRDSVGIAKFFLPLAALLNCTWLCIAPRIQGNGQVNLNVKNATCYPTADGLWPTGGGLNFLWRLKNSYKPYRAIDHNQEIWALWEKWPLTIISPAPKIITQTALASYPSLALNFHGIQSEIINQSLTLSTDRAWLGTEKRDYSKLTLKKANYEHIYDREYVNFQYGGRFIFINPPQHMAHECNDELFDLKSTLIKKHPRIEFLLVNYKDSTDGHLYLKAHKRGLWFKSNYPTIIFENF